MTGQGKNPAASEGPAMRMELNYCERCGALSVHAAETPVWVCAACTKALRWLREGGRR